MFRQLVGNRNMDGVTVAYAPYVLTPRIRLGKFSCKMREGALLRFTFGKNLVGYSDCHPWPELGDLPLSQQLNQLKDGKLTPLLERSLELARNDAEARDQGIHLLSGLTAPQSHYLVDEVCSHAYLKVKVDGSKAPPRWLHEIGKQQRLRLDFNGSLTDEHLEDWRELLESLNLDFIEDPFSEKSWLPLNAFPLAKDRDSEQGIDQDVGTLIVKPAIQNPILFEKVSGQRIVFTSYADHPLGQVCAAWEAARFYQKHPQFVDRCGLLSHLIYEPNAYSEQLSIEDDRLCVCGGTGFGFDQLLHDVAWKLL